MAVMAGLKIVAVSSTTLRWYHKASGRIFIQK